MNGVEKEEEVSRCVDSRQGEREHNPNHTYVLKYVYITTIFPILKKDITLQPICFHGHTYFLYCSRI